MRAGYLPFVLTSLGDLTELGSSEDRPVSMLELPESELESEIRRRLTGPDVREGKDDF